MELSLKKSSGVGRREETQIEWTGMVWSLGYLFRGRSLSIVDKIRMLKGVFGSPVSFIQLWVMGLNTKEGEKWNIQYVIFKEESRKD